MSTQTSRQDLKKGKQSSTPPTGEDSFNELFNILRPFFEGEHGQNLRTILEGNKTLTEEVNDLRTAYKTNLQALAQQQIAWDAERARLQKELESERARFEQSLSEKQDADAKLNAERYNTDNLRQQIRNNEKNIKSLIDARKLVEGDATKLRGEKDVLLVQLESTGKKNNALQEELEKKKWQYDANASILTDAKESLATVRSFLVPLHGLDDATRASMFVISSSSAV
ncbi:hypothetical protein NHJ6243_009914 [Beauveria neobassiana]